MTAHGDIPDRHYYDSDYYKTHLERLRKHDRFTQVKVQRVRHLLAPEAGEWVLDFGCGVGTMMILLADTGARFAGIDYSDTSLKTARSLHREFTRKDDFAGVCTAGEALPLKQNSIDGIMAVDFTEHITDEMLRGMLQETYRVLRTGGRLLIYTPNPQHLFERLKDKNFILKQDPSHIGLRTMDTYKQFALDAGFQVQREEFEPTHLPLYAQFESLLMHIPIIGSLARRRICLVLTKS